MTQAPNISEYRRDLAWNAGAKAYREGKPRSKNNRQPGTIYAKDWYDGYDHAWLVDNQQ